MGKLFDKDYQGSRRGPSFKTMLLDGLREESTLKLRANASKESAERAFIAHVATRALNPKDKNSHILLQELLKKCYPAHKATLPLMDIPIDIKLPPAEQCDQIIAAIASGDIAADVGQCLTAIIRDRYTILEISELQDKMRELEIALTGVTNE